MSFSKILAKVNFNNTFEYVDCRNKKGRLRDPFDKTEATERN